MGRVPQAIHHSVHDPAATPADLSSPVHALPRSLDYTVQSTWTTRLSSCDDQDVHLVCVPISTQQSYTQHCDHTISTVTDSLRRTEILPVE